MAFRAFDRSLPSFYLLITRRALWITRKRVPHSLRARWSLRVRPWITAGRYPPASLRLLAFFKCWMGYLASAVSNTPPAALPGATRRREARGAGVAGCALRPCPHSHRLSATVQRQGAVSSLRCGPHQPLDPAPSQESFSKHPESLCAAFSRGGPCPLLPARNGSLQAVSGCFPAEPVVKVGVVQPSQPCRLADNERSEASASSPCHSLNDE